MWPEAIVAGLGVIGASAAYVVHKARNYSGGWSASDIDRANYRRGTTTPPWNTEEYNRREPAPGDSFRPPGPPPAFYGTATPPPPPDWATFWKAQDEARRAGTSRFGEDGTWRQSPDDTEPPEYDGPTGR